MPPGSPRAAGGSRAREQVVALRVDGFTTLATGNGLARKNHYVTEESTFHANNPLVVRDNVVRAIGCAGDGGVVASVREDQGLVTLAEVLEEIIADGIGKESGDLALVVGGWSHRLILEMLEDAVCSPDSCHFRGNA